MDPVPQPNVAPWVEHSFEQANARHRNEEKDAHDIAVYLWGAVGSVTTVTVPDLTLMYAFRVRHNLNRITVKREQNTHIYHGLLERRDEQLDEIERSGIHEFIWRPDQTDGFGCKECQKLCFSILNNLDRKNSGLTSR
jgi:hypothetical protein